MMGYDFDYSLTGDRSVDVPVILDQVIRLGEEMIREAPEQWIGWFGLKNWRKSAQQILELKSKAQSQKVGWATDAKMPPAIHRRERPGKPSRLHIQP